MLQPVEIQAKVADAWHLLDVAVEQLAYPYGWLEWGVGGPSI